MVIDGSGNVGIGTTSPGAALVVESGSTVLSSIFDSTNASGAYIKTTSSGVGSLYMGSLKALRASGPWASTDGGITAGGILNLAVNGNVAAVDALTILTSGNVGIGTTTPYSRLSVWGAGTGATSLFELTNSASTTLASVLNDGTFYMKGNVGIGTTSPYRLLSLAYNSGGSAGTVTNPTALIINDTGNTNTWDTTNPWGSIDFSTSDVGANKLYARIGNVMTAATGNSSRLSFFLSQGSGTSLFERMTIDGLTGRVGVGSTSPLAALSVTGAGVGTGLTFQTTNSSYTPTFTIVDNGNVGIGETAPGSKLSVKGGMTVGNDTAYSQIAAPTDGMIIKGNVGIGTTSPSYLLSVGSSAPSGVVAQFENSTGSCYINPTTTSLVCNSDLRLKTNISSLSSSSTLAALRQLHPVTFNWARGEAIGSSTHTGFIAQEVQPFFPDLVSSSTDGYLNMNYAGLTPYLVLALQDLAGKADVWSATTTPADIASDSGPFASASLFLRGLITGLGDIVVRSVNGAIYAATGVFERLFAKEVHTDKLCVSDESGETCVTRTQLDALLAGTGASSPASSGGGGGGAPTANPATTDSSTAPPTDVGSVPTATTTESAPVDTTASSTPLTTELAPATETVPETSTISAPEPTTDTPLISEPVPESTPTSEPTPEPVVTTDPTL